MQIKMSLYDHKKAEKKWQKKWAKDELYKTDFKNTKQEKYYNLVMFPYPSGDKLHIGHWYNFAPADSWGRYKRMQGFNVFEPMGYDSFGLPAENYAIKHGVHPAESTAKNIKYMTKQLSEMGSMYDWNSEVQTSSPEYYKWTQWLFLQLYKKDLAYKQESPVNWCPKCQTVLANEQVQDGQCERCESEVTKKDLSQWFFKIRDYADRLLDFKGLDWPEKTKLMQENWIGKSHGCDIYFPLEDGSDRLTCYTTRADTIYSVTFIVMAPEHPLVDEFTKGTKYEQQVKDIRKKIDKQSLIERTSEGGDDKLGCFLGKYAINPVNGQKIPIYLANFALMYGTGVVMADAHDQRDFEFAQKYDIPLKFVISEDGSKIDPKDHDEAFLFDGILFDSGEFSGISNRKALPKMMDWLEKESHGKKTTNYRLRDWLISRQRFWGAPIPIVYCDKCGEVPVPEKDLPVTLPLEGVDFKLKGKSPLAYVEEFVNVACPKCKGDAKREVDTMDTFVCSSWYFLRYPSANNKEEAFNKETTNKWLPVDMYIGGPEHACMHLLYARFINKVLKDLGFINFEEPFKKLVHQGLITKDGAKMSKSKGNVVSPDEFIDKYGSDVFRMYMMFMGPFTDGGDWNDSGIKGIARFIDKFFDLIYTDVDVQDEKGMKVALNRAIKKVTDDIENLQFNTCVSALMEFTNTAGKTRIDNESKQKAVKLIAPLAPHLAEELWAHLGHKESVFYDSWPEYDEAYLETDTIELVVQINGKVRAKTEAPSNISEKDAIELAKGLENTQKYIQGKQMIKEIYVPGKLVNLVVK